MDSNIVEFPGRKPSTDEVHAEAFRDLEGHISDCVSMCQIAAQAMSNTKCEDDKLAFAVFHTYEMLLNLSKFYKAAWEGDMPGTRLITGPAKTTREIKKTSHEAIEGQSVD